MKQEHFKKIDINTFPKAENVTTHSKAWYAHEDYKKLITDAITTQI
jgi:hypothetical protein